MPDTTIVVPCYNEAHRFDPGVFRSYAHRQERVRFLFVDDGSTDDTAKLLESLRDEVPTAFEVHRLPRNLGKGEAVRRGLLEACRSQPAYVGYWDADLATPLDEIPGFLALLDARPGIQMVVGARVNLLGRRVQRRLWRHYVSRVFATVVSQVLRLPIYDSQCGAKIFRTTEELRGILADPFISRWIFDVEVLARYVAARSDTDLPPLRDIVYEQPLLAWHEVRGSKIEPRDYLTLCADLVRIHRRYLRRRG